MEARRSGTLFVVATPIGNLEDITLRALRVLREVALIAAEDTRRTGNLLRHYGIDTPLISLHEHNEHQRRAQLVARLAAGESVALVSDAGTPGISDPGALFVSAAREAGIRVDPVPGPSAATAALSASGLNFERFAFGGFPPIKSNDRNKWLDWVKSHKTIPVVCFEAPHRLAATLDSLRQYLGDRPIIVARELTKLHESWTFLSPHAPDTADLSENPLPKGEIVIIIAPEREAVRQPEVPSDDEIGLEFGRTTEISVSSRREQVRRTAETLGIRVKTVYEALERLKRS